MSADDAAPWYRLGYVSPHLVVDTLAYEIYRMAPPGLMLATTGLEIADYTPAAVEAQLPDFRRAVTRLVERRVDRVVLSGVPLAAGLGRPRMRQILDEAAEAAGVPVDTDLEAIVAALAGLGARRVALATRWHEDVNRAVAAYLADAGVEVLGIESDARSMRENARLDDSTGIRLAHDLGARALSATPRAEALVMPGGRWLAIDAVEPLEARFGCPVVVNFAAALWAALHDHGYDRPIRGWGRVLASLGG
jgi:maleate cis-trans isomerase